MKSRHIVIPALVVAIVFAVSFVWRKSSNPPPPACLGELSKVYQTAQGETKLEGLLMLQFTGQRSGRAQLSGWITDSDHQRFRVSRLVTFELQPEGQKNLFLSHTLELEKTPDDNVDDARFRQFTMLSRSRIYLGVYQLNSDAIAVTENGVPFLVCSSRDIP